MSESKNLGEFLLKLEELKAKYNVKVATVKCPKCNQLYKPYGEEAHQLPITSIVRCPYCGYEEQAIWDKELGKELARKKLGLDKTQEDEEVRTLKSELQSLKNEVSTLKTEVDQLKKNITEAEPKIPPELKQTITLEEEERKEKKREKKEIEKVLKRGEEAHKRSIA